jgi:hypothetical protein
MAHRPPSSRAKVARHRDRLRAAGLRPVQLWLPDTRAPGFAAEAERQARLADAAPDFDAVMGWIEDASEFDGAASR